MNLRLFSLIKSGANILNLWDISVKMYKFNYSICFHHNFNGFRLLVESTS